MNNKLFTDVIVECLIKRSNIRLNPFALLTIARASKHTRTALIAAKNFSGWIDAKCFCSRCKNFDRVPTEYRQYLSQFFGYGIPTKFEFKDPLKFIFDCIVVSLDHRSNISLEMNTLANIVEVVEFPKSDGTQTVARPSAVKYYDHYVGTGSGILRILGAESVENFWIKTTRPSINWENFQSLSVLSLFFTKKHKLDAGVLPSTLENLTLAGVDVVGNFTCYKMKHFNVKNCNFQHNFALPESLETLISYTCENLILPSNLKCFGHQINSDSRKSFSLPQNLEIYVQYPTNRIWPGKSPFYSAEIDGVQRYFLRESDEHRFAFLWLLTQKEIKFDVKLPQSLRVLSAFSTFTEPHSLPNLVELHIFLICQKDAIVNSSITAEWAMPNLRTLVFTNVKNPLPGPDPAEMVKHVDLIANIFAMIPSKLYRVTCYFPTENMLSGKMPFIPTAKNTTIHLYKTTAEFDAKEELFKGIVGVSNNLYLANDSQKYLEAFMESQNITLEVDQYISITRCGLIDILAVKGSVNENGQHCNKFAYSPHTVFDKKELHGLRPE
jgi:hypothetical protein